YCAFFYKQKTAYELETGLEFRRVLFRSLNFTSFLSEGTGIIIMGGLLSTQFLNYNFLSEFITFSTNLYSNILIGCTIIIALCCLLTFILFNRTVKQHT